MRDPAHGLNDDTRNWIARHRKKKKMKVLVTGHKGFIGSHV